MESLTKLDCPNLKKIKNIVLDLDNTLISAEPATEFPYDKEGITEKCLKFPFYNMDDYYIVFERPHLQEFLDFIFKNYNVSVWTAASQSYALYIIQHILLSKPERKLDFIFFSYHCSISKKKKRRCRKKKEKEEDKDDSDKKEEDKQTDKDQSDKQIDKNQSDKQTDKDQSDKQTGCSKDLSLLYKIFKLKGFSKKNTLIIDDLDEIYNFQPENCINIKEFNILDEGSENDDELLKIKEKLSSSKD